MISFIQTSIYANAFTEGAETVVLFADSFRETLCSKFPTTGKYIIGAFLVGGVVVGLISSIVDNYYSYKSLMEENKINNIDSILKSMKNNIEAKNYLGKNYYFVSTNYGVGEAATMGIFAKKDGIKYNVEYDEAYFKKVIEHIDNVLKIMQDGSFFEHNTHEYDTKINSAIKTVRKVAIGARVVSEGVSLAKKNGWNLEKIKEWLKKEGETEDIDKKAESIKELVDSDYSEVLNNAEEAIVNIGDKMSKSAPAA